MVQNVNHNPAQQPAAAAEMPQTRSTRPNCFQKFKTDLIFTLGGCSSLHVPMFNLYFKFKNNVFLNTEDANAKHLEAAGNWILTPMRYLFAGKTVERIEGERVEEMRLSFAYDEDSGAMDIFKTVVAICSLPISLILGATLKGFSYISSSVQEKHQMIQQEFLSTRVVDNTEIYRQSGIEQVFAQEVLPHQNYPAPPPTPRQIAHMEAVRDVAAILKENNIPHWMDCGTLIGAYRHGRMIPWDSDVDMGILSTDFTNTLNLLRGLDPEKYEIQDWSCSRRPNLFLRVLLKQENSYLDLYNHALNPENQTLCYQYSWKDSPWVFEALKRRELVQEREIPINDYFPLKEAQFGEAVVSVPRNWEAVLRVKYGENLEPCRVWNEQTQEYDRVPNHPYWNQSDI